MLAPKNYIFQLSAIVIDYCVWTYSWKTYEILLLILIISLHISFRLFYVFIYPQNDPFVLYFQYFIYIIFPVLLLGLEPPVIIEYCSKHLCGALSYERNAFNVSPLRTIFAVDFL